MLLRDRRAHARFALGRLAEEEEKEGPRDRFLGPNYHDRSEILTHFVLTAFLCVLLSELTDEGKC